LARAINEKPLFRRFNFCLIFLSKVLMGDVTPKTGKVRRNVFDFLHDQNFLSALAVAIGPLAFFAAPTEEIEHLLLHTDIEISETEVCVPAYATVEAELAEAA
jgi:hypothetical protein